MSYIPYASQTLESEDVEAIHEVLRSSWITRGPKVQALEEAICAYCNVPYTVLFNSGTTALEAAYYAVNLQPEDVLYSSANTFVGTLSGALKRSERLIFLDIDFETKSPNFDLLSNLPLKSRAVLIPVHFSGMAKKIQKPRQTDVLIEDACQAFGALYPSGEKVGSCPTSDLTVFSFHPAKTICMGEGGAVTTQDHSLYQRLLLYRNNGIVKHEQDLPWMYHVEDLTTNAHVTELSAALGLSQLKRIDSFLEKRRALVQRYREHLQEVQEITFSPKAYDIFSSHNILTLEIDFEAVGQKREFLMKALLENKIATQVHYIPLYRHPYFKRRFSFSLDAFPNQERYYSKALTLPLYSHLSLSQVDEICQKLKAALFSLSPAC